MVRHFQPRAFLAVAALAALIGGSGCSSGYVLPDGGIVGGGNGGLGGVNNPQNDGGSDAGVVDAGSDDGGMADSGCSPATSVTGCYGQGQSCQPSIYLNGGCVSGLICYSRFDADAGAAIATCCDFSTGVYQC